MKPLTANLKHLYQYRFMWIFHLILAMAISSLFRGMISVGPPDSPYLVSWIIFTLYGEMISLSMTGISNKPFAFCLPDHVREVKKMLLTIWLVITIVCFLILSILYVLNIHLVASNLLFHLLSMIFPKIMLMGKSSTITVSWSLLAAVPFIMVPLFGGFSVLFRGIILMIALSVTVFFAIIISFCAGIAMENIPFIMNPVIVLFVAAITWVFHIAALYYTSMKRSLC